MHKDGRSSAERLPYAEMRRNALFHLFICSIRPLVLPFGMVHGMEDYRPALLLLVTHPVLSHEGGCLGAALHAQRAEDSADIVLDRLL